MVEQKKSVIYVQNFKEVTELWFILYRGPATAHFDHRCARPVKLPL